MTVGVAVGVVMALASPLVAAEAPSLPVKSAGNGVTYVSGGIGSSEAETLRAEASRYSLALTLAQTRGGHEAYLASVPVKIVDAGGNTLLDVVSDGPLLLVNLAPGAYRVSAKHSAIEKWRDVVVKAGSHQAISFVWVKAPNAGEPAPAPVDTTADLPPVKTQDGIPYLTGGIGKPESQAIKAQFPKHSMALTFARHQNGNNDFLSDIPVTVRRADGTSVLQVTTEGPYLLVDLPPATYEVIANYQGKEQRATLKVAPGQRAERSFVWSQ